MVSDHTISEKEAREQNDAIMKIMAETKMNFGDAVNEYIRRGLAPKSLRRKEAVRSPTGGDAEV